MTGNSENSRRGRIVGRWLGGYTRRDLKGRVTYIIEREVGERRFHISTRCHDKEGALKHLARFEADPGAYRPAGVVAREGLHITADLVDEFSKFQTKKEVSAKHRHYTEVYLLQWLEDLDGRDLRALNLGELKTMIDNRKVCRPARIAALKVFCSWLRREKGLLKTAEDTTLELAVPQARPEKRLRRKAVEWNRVRKVAKKLEGISRDCLALLCATGWHLSELTRFAAAGELAPGVRKSRVLAVLTTRHKGGELTRTPLQHEAHVEAARRLLKAGSVPQRLDEHLAAACAAAKVESFTLGVIRHSVATWAVERGASPDEVARFLGHRDRRTTERFYIDLRVPTVTVPVGVL